MIKKLLLFLFTIVLLVCLGTGALFYMEYSRKTKEGKSIEVEIPEGTGTKGIIQILKDKGVIRYESPFYLKLYRSENRGKLRYGTFTLNDGMSLDDIIATLTTGGGQKDGLVLTIPEGFTAEMIAARLEEQGIMSGEEFIEALKRAAKEVEYKDQLPAEDQVYYQLQGYLFPDTYYLDEDMTGDDLVAMLLEEFDKQVGEERKAKAKEMGMSLTEVLTRASLLEKEASLEKEFATIAGVINNRIEKNMPLQFDSTVVYAMSEGKYGVERVMYADLKLDSPYNTYKVKGLPAGPICNPGLQTIDAVLNPEEHSYLFFQTDTNKNDGSNLFFETYEEHLAASSTADRGGDTEKGK